VVEGARQADVGLAAQHHLQHFLGVSGAHRDHHARACGLETVEHVGQKVRADGERSRDADGARRRRAPVVDGLTGEGDGL
jgi:hypothetical protein